MKAIGDIESLLGALPPCLVFDAEGRIVQANAAAAALLGYALQELVGMRAEDLVPEAARSAHSEHRSAFAAAPRSGPMGTGREFAALRADGRLVPVEVGLTPIGAGEGLLVLALVTDISQRLAAVEELRRSEERFRELADTLPQLVTTAEADGRVRFANRAVLAYLGFPDAAEVHARLEHIFHPDDAAASVAAWERSLAESVPFDRTHRLRRHDGAYRWFRTQGRPILSEAGEVAGWVISSDDIDESRRLNEQLRREQERFDQVATAAPGAIFERVLHPDGRSTVPFASPSLTDITGVSPEELREDGRVFLRIVLEEDIAAFQAAVAVHEDTDRPWTVEYRIRHPQKGIRWLRADMIQRPRSDGAVVSYGVITDVTESRQAEAALHRTEEQLRLFIEFAPAAIAMLDRDMRYIAVSRRWLVDFGLGDVDIVGRSHFDVFPEVPERWREILRHCLGGSSASADDDPFPRLDGTVQWLRWEVLPWHDEAGDVGGLILASEDITHRKHAEEQQLRAQKLESLGTLAGGIAHDFNNILLAIRGYTDLAMRDLPEGHRSRALLDQVTRGADRATELVQRILAFSRPAPPHREPLDLRRSVQETLDLLRPTLPSLLDLRSAFPAELPAVGGDPGQIHQVLVNLVGNASHAIGRVPGTISIALEALPPGEGPADADPGAGDHGWVQLAVSDTGSGMDAPTMERIFDPFFSTKPQGSGTGLGLATVHAIVRGHGGSIAVSSRPGEGSVFRLVFPALPAEQAAVAPASAVAASAAVAPAPAAAPAPGAAPARGSGQRILVVDDETALVDVMVRSLGRSGFAPRGFASADEGLAAFRADPDAFDGALLDLTMPHMSGIQLARELLALRPGLPVLIASGYVPDDDRLEGERIGVAGFVSKSEEPAVIRARLAEVLAAGGSGAGAIEPPDEVGRVEDAERHPGGADPHGKP